MSSHMKLDFDFGNHDSVLDPAVEALIPQGSSILRVTPHGESFWASIGRISVSLSNGVEQSFFIKMLCGNIGKYMVQSEFESMDAIYRVTATFVPRPLGHGTFASMHDTHFLLCEFRHMSAARPDPGEFSKQLAALHQNSQSPNGKFGFHVTTYAGNLPQCTEWEDSWQVFFSKSLRKALDLEIAAKGNCKELETLVTVIFETVIPRLLGPLESEGRSVKPCLVHGDLWHANSGVDDESKETLVFDACCFYAHNEYEFGQWMPECNQFGKEYLDAYHQIVPISEPKVDYQGRLDLYKLRFNTHVSALFNNDRALREQMLGDMRDLVRRYGDCGSVYI